MAAGGQHLTYFVTSRLVDSMPAEKLRQWAYDRQCWLVAHSLRTAAEVHTLPEEQQKDYHQHFTDPWHQWLDAGHGECWLRQPALGLLLAEALQKGHPQDYALDAWVIMPNHLHALLTPLSATLSNIRMEGCERSWPYAHHISQSKRGIPPPECLPFYQ